MLTVLMATFNGAATLPKVLAAYCLLQAPPGGWRLLVVDNGSTDNTLPLLMRFTSRLPLQVLHEPRRGKNMALNCGLDSLAPGSPQDLLVFTDDDAAPQPDWLLQLFDAAWRQPLFDIFGGAIEADWAMEAPAWLRQQVPLGLTFGITDASRPEGPVFPGLVWGANMAIRAHLFAGGLRFNDALGPNAGSYAMGGEVELTRRLADAGHQAWFCAGARVAHHIRARQMSEAWVLERARRFGRGEFHQQPQGVFPELLRVPRWMFTRALHELAGLLRAAASSGAGQTFMHRWELARLRGYLEEAWSAPPRRPVFITSYSGELGGMEMRMAQEGRYLRAAGLESVLAVAPFRGARPWLQGLRAAGQSVLEFAPPPVFEQWRWRRLNRLRAVLWHAPRLRKAHPALVHVAYCWTSYGSTALWLASRCALPTVISVHNAFPREPVSTWHEPLLRQAFAGVRGVYAVSRSALEHFLAIYRDYLPPAARQAVIPNGIDTQRFHPSREARRATRAAWGVPDDAPLIGCVGRLSPQKRPDQLIYLLKALLPGFPGLTLVFAGSGPLERALRRRADAVGVTDHVIFAGFQSEVEKVLPALDLHLLLSRREGFGIATIEAMACGVPCVASDVPGNADVLGGSAGGVLVPAGDLHATAATVAALLADPARRLHMAEQGRAEVCARYDHRIVQAQVHAFYRGLV